MKIDISDFLKKVFDHYDNLNLKYSKYVNGIIKYNENKFTIENKEINKYILGCFYHKTNTFIWGWIFPSFTLNENKFAKELLNYGLTLDPNTGNINHYFLKTLLVNSRINIDNDFELELLLSISSYLLKEKIDFIYKQETYDEKNNLFLTEYWIVKIKK